ncbi:MAG: hypothetical protein AAFR16_10610, partial [Pseudomonadota bacterium]
PWTAGVAGLGRGASRVGASRLWASRLGAGLLVALLSTAPAAAEDLIDLEPSASRAGQPLPSGAGPDGDDALVELLDAARDGSGDPHLPYVLVRLKRALSEQDVIAFLDLVDPKYFSEQFSAMSGPDRSPGAAMAQFTCEFVSVCDIAKTYKFSDVVSMRLVSVGRLDTPLDQPVEIRIELRMWDGVLVPSTIYYSRQSYRLFAAAG